MNEQYLLQAFFEVGGFDRSLKFCFDYDLFLRLAQRRTPSGVNRILAASRAHDAAKSSTIWDSIGREEKLAVQKRHGIDSFDRDGCMKIQEETQKRLKQLNMRGLAGDAFQDPAFFAKTVASRVRDSVFKGRRRKHNNV